MKTATPFINCFVNDEAPALVHVTPNVQQKTLLQFVDVSTHD